MTIKLYYAKFSPPVRAVLFNLKMLNIHHELINVDVSKKENKSEEYLKINPLGTVPTMIDNNFVIIDSHAINKYLVNKYAKDDKLYPKDINAQSVVDQRLFFDNGVLFTALKNVMVKIVIEKTLTAVTSDIIRSFENTYGFLEKFLNSTSYIAGNHITIADLSVITTLTTLDILVPVRIEKFPFVIAYIDRCKKTFPSYSEINEEGLNMIRQLLASFQFQLSAL
ncbi:hypothetical protein PGB90_005130 [Kerria lacca]